MDLSLRALQTNEKLISNWFSKFLAENQKIFRRIEKREN